MVYLTRKIEFSAAHLYHNPAFSEEENRRVFGKCNNPNGHGHNYVLEVTVGGETDPETGMVLDLKELKEILEREIMERMDHRFLNYEVPELAGQIPTCENIAALIWSCWSTRSAKDNWCGCGFGSRRTFTSIATGTGTGGHEGGTHAAVRVCRLASVAQSEIGRSRKSPAVRQVQ